VTTHPLSAEVLANMPLTRSDAQAGDTVTTPTVVHFGAVLPGDRVRMVARAGSPVVQREVSEPDGSPAG
jgi:hypothetical protein